MKRACPIAITTALLLLAALPATAAHAGDAPGEFREVPLELPDDAPPEADGMPEAAEESPEYADEVLEVTAEEIGEAGEDGIPGDADSGLAAERADLGAEGLDHALTQKYRDMMLTPARQKWLAAVLARGADYRPYIRAQLEARGMPAYIEYLPVVESEFILTARSKSGALGMWQFMENSMRPFLKKTAYIDERCDPWKSTDAALSKLQENYARFGDWLLALAAYNCGAGAMEKVLRTSPERDFWYLAEHGLLKDQSTQYIPKLLAISDLVINREFYGLDLPELDEDWRDRAEPDFDYITLEASVNLSTLAEKAEIPLAELERLNPELVKKRTPYEQYQVRIAAGTRETVTANLKSNGAVTRIDYSKYEQYKVIKGDTLYALARKRNTTVGDIQLLNNLGSSSKIFIGQNILLPIVK